MKGRTLGGVTRARGALAAAAMMLALAGGPARGELVAVVVGIDDYEHVTKLGGAVADAEDLAASLTWLGARTELLLDHEASRAELLAALDRAIASTGPDGVIVFSFAGHGIQIPDLDGDEADGFDEAFVLPGYRTEVEDRDNLLIDDEVDRLIRRAAPRTFILLADSCHSGTMLRGVDRRSDFRSTRFVPRSSFGGAPPMVTSRAAAAAERLTFQRSRNLIFFGAVPENIGVQEVLINGRPRGALSYAFARAVEGQADQDEDGTITTDDLTFQVPELVRALSDNRQTPQIVTGPASRGFVLELPEGPAPGEPPAPAVTTAAAQPSSEPATWAPPSGSGGEREVVLVASSDGSSEVFAALRGVEVVAPADADLILHQPSGDLLTSNGDVAARLGPAREPRLLQGIVDKWRLLGGLNRSIDGRVQARVLPDDGVFHNGDPFTIRVTTRDAGHLVVFDLASDGSLLVLYPRRDGAAPWLAAGETHDLPLVAGPPFGGDHLVAAVVPQDVLPRVQDVLLQTHGRPPSRDQVAELKRLLAPHGPLPVAVYTAP